MDMHAAARQSRHPRAKRVRTRSSNKELLDLQLKPPSVSPTSSRSATPCATPSLASPTPSLASPTAPVLTVSSGEQLRHDYQVHELPSESGDDISYVMSTSTPGPSHGTEVLVNCLSPKLIFPYKNGPDVP